MSLITELAQAARNASRQLAILDSDSKNQVLQAMSSALRANQEVILAANLKDLDAAKANGLSEAMLDRLTLTPARINAMADGIDTIVKLADPVGLRRELGTRPNGIKVSKLRVPLGVVCMIYEARPNVTADAGALCFKSGNAVILRGGKEALGSSLAIAAVLQQVLRLFNLPEALITVVPDPDRALMLELLQQRQTIDLVIPRGGEGLINFVTDNSKIPVIQHFKGVCHLYVDRAADVEKALNLLLNGKTQRTGVCNALEGLLVHKEIAPVWLPIAAQALKDKGVKINCDAASAAYFAQPTVLTDEQFGAEYLGLEIAIRQVDSLDGAMNHIARFGSHHTEVICTEDLQAAAQFQQAVDASVVMVNASSRFSDGAELGLGAEIGIATTKLHAYGPMGLESLTTEKYLVNGAGQIRD
ncbi:glutamate-5-semialdehyde dehydrogenase [Shewanella dokdonensis]|uniref:Gamma-glutamyl phosphate reductase n=1 Tax=Shewanella dokdonensis TaxID=712036 RepID=A0ABX8DHT7_9GAMM|nr:glutamate-5-semialdehyde dehydrogenase [Shewanella dokdonensis]MCL1075888.1 glutamate-5-semialdehyde dehydrogenase [Shewanella dokdonensis]QVK24211.1 glutamate-5-semialdehyde dehydrogenase [Shewanella dokdonensis]